MNTYKRIKFGDEIIPKFTSEILINSPSEEIIPQYGGVYIFRDLRGILYIGETVNLLRRFNEHRFDLNSKLNKFLATPIHSAYFSWIRKSNRKDRLQLEKDLVSFFHPICNSILFKTNHDRRKLCHF